MIGGYVENFSSVSHWCRYRLFPKSDLDLGLFSPAPYHFRTKANYQEALGKKEAEQTHWEGVKCNSEFNSLSFSRVASPGLPPCLGHDLFEGVVKVDLSIFLEYFVKGKK